MPGDIVFFGKQTANGTTANRVAIVTEVIYTDNSEDTRIKVIEGDVEGIVTNVTYKQNEAVMLDFGCVYKGYCSDITRSWWFGDKEPAEYTKIWTTVDKAWKAGIAAEKPGMTGQQVDSVARDIITQAGYGEYFTHRLGHGVGLEIHEQPCNDQNNPNPLQKGNVITVEPGIYLPGKYGVRLEETTVITDTGADILTRK